MAQTAASAAFARARVGSCGVELDEVAEKIAIRRAIHNAAGEPIKCDWRRVHHSRAQRYAEGLLRRLAVRKRGDGGGGGAGAGGNEEEPHIYNTEYGVVLYSMWDDASSSLLPTHMRSGGYPSPVVLFEGYRIRKLQSVTARKSLFRRAHITARRSSQTVPPLLAAAQQRSHDDGRSLHRSPAPRGLCVGLARGTP